MDLKRLSPFIQSKNGSYSLSSVQIRDTHFHPELRHIEAFVGDIRAHFHQRVSSNSWTPVQFCGILPISLMKWLKEAHVTVRS